MRSSRPKPHPSHHRGDQFPADHHAFAAQQLAQYPAARERVVQIQRVDPTHDHKLGCRDRPRLIV
jgi:hypothetical protein